MTVASAKSLRSRSHQPLKGITFTVFGIAFITFNDAMLKLVVTEHLLGQSIFIRGAFAMLPILFLVRRNGGLTALRAYDIRGQMFCALLLALPIYMFVFSLRHLDLGVATILLFAGPLIASMLAGWLLGERVGWQRWCAIGFGFAGVVLVVQPTAQSFDLIMLLPLGVAVLVAARDLVIRRIAATESSISIHFYSSCSVMLVALVTSVHVWQPLPWQAWLQLALSGMGFGFGIYLLTDALRYADVSLVSPFKYSSVLWALVLGFVLWGEVPTSMVVAGAMIVVASGLFLLRSRE